MARVSTKEAARCMSCLEKKVIGVQALELPRELQPTRPCPDDRNVDV
jgi:hypothetical protein